MAWSYWCGYCEKDWPHVSNKYAVCPLCNRACDTEKDSVPMAESEAEALVAQTQLWNEKVEKFNRYLEEQEEREVAAFRGELDAWLSYQ